MTKYTKISVSILSAVIFSYAVIVSPVFAIDAEDDGSAATNSPSAQDDGSTTAESNTQDDGSTAGSSTQDDGSTAGSNTQDDGSTAGSSTQDDGSTAGSSNNGGNETPPSSGSSSSSRGGRSSRKSNATTTTVVKPIITNVGDCSYLTSYMKIGGNNNASEVTKLQNFLKNTEKLSVDVNGIFDQKTFDAVKAFQAKYVEEIMVPWGVRIPSGHVFYTTKNKVNEIVCKANFNLTAAQIAQIEAYRKGVTGGSITIDANNASSTVIPSPEVGSNTDSSQEASAAGTSVTGKVWTFIKWLFGY